MIRKILVFPLRVVRFFLMAIGVVVFITVGICDYFIQNRGSVSPVIYSKDGKVVDLNDFRNGETRGES